MNFNQCFDKVIGHEGGYINDPKDPGGETNWGISKRAYPHLDIKKLTKADAKKIYYMDYWLKAGCNLLPSELSYPVFDAAVNQGIKSAIIFLQKSIGSDPDGLIGENTRNKINQIARNPEKLQKVKRDMLTERTLQYTKTKNFDRYGRGWIRRVLDVAMT